jgi:hypothetical protein
VQSDGFHGGSSANGGGGDAVNPPPVVRLVPSLLRLFRDGDLFGVAGMQDHREEARLALLARVPRHPVEAAGRLVERVPGL